MIKAELDLEYGKFYAKLSEATNKALGEKDKLMRGSSGFSGNLGGSFAKSMSGVQGLLPVATLAGSVAMLKGVVDKFGDIKDKADALNESAETIQRVTQVSKEFGGSLEGVSSATLKLEKNLGDLENTGAREALERYGLTTEKLMSMPLDEKLVALSDAFQKARRDGTGLADLQSLLGKGSSELIPMLEAGGDSLRKRFAEISVVSDEAVDRLDTLGDKVDRFFSSLSAASGQGISDFGKWASFLGDLVGNVMLEGPSAGWEKSLANVAASDTSGEDAAKRNADRRAKAKALAGAQEKAATDDAAKKQKDVDDKAAKDKESAMKRIAAMQKDISKESINALPDDAKLGVLGDELQDIFDTMQKSGGAFFDPSVEGLGKLAEARIKNGDLAGAEAALGLLKEAQSIMNEMDGLTAKLRKEGSDAAKDLADKVDSLRKDTGKSGLDLLPPKERMEAFKNELKSAFGFDVKSGADVKRGLAGLQDQADEAKKRGDRDGEKSALEKLKGAQESAKNLASIEVPQVKQTIGSLGGAVNRILGRDANEIVAEETRRQTDVLQQIERLLRENFGGGNRNQPQSPYPTPFADVFR